MQLDCIRMYLLAVFVSIHSSEKQNEKDVGVAGLKEEKKKK